METYEALILVKPDFSQEQIDAVLDKISKNITSNQGNVKDAKLWKKADLAYEVEKNSKGIYLLVLFEMAPENIEKLKRFFKLDQDVLRELILKK